MQQRTVGQGGSAVGAVGLGCMGMSWAYDPTGWDERTSVEVIRTAVDSGVTLIDTADYYGPYVNEELVGRALADGWRERAFLATKVGLTVGPNGERMVRDGRPEHIRRSIDESLRRLGTDHVDLYQLHRVDPAVPLEESWGVLAEAVAAGKARAIGLSEVTVEEIRRAQAVHPVASVQSELSLWSRGALAEVLPYTERQGIAFLPFSPLGRGLLTGRFTTPADLPPGDLRAQLERFQPDALQANQPLVDRVQAVADRHGATSAQIALAWVLAQGEYVIPIPGTKTPRYLAQNAGAAGLTLTADDLAALDALPQAVGSR
ncbi:aldo/keto reductase [Kitasatospora sp. NPDC049285]|uniref:aldo/keto reductase n=1 Tax=Kitasatospora sp. NPDC049285 TaxID=3157096 RepID=UPI003413124D